MVYDVRYGIKSPADAATVRDFFVCRDGAAHSFRFKDPSLFTTAANGYGAHARTDELIGTGDGTTVTFQLKKTFTSSAGNRAKNIYLPVSGTVLVEKAGVLQTENTNYTVNYTTGIVTFTAAPTAGQQVKAGCEWDQHLRFHQSLDINSLPIVHEGFDIKTIPSIPLLEVVAETVQAEDVYPMTATVLTIGASYSLSPAQFGAASFSASTTGLTVYLPLPTECPYGGPFYWIQAPSGSQTYTVKSGTTTIDTMTAGKKSAFFVVPVSGAKTWEAYA